MAITSKSGIYKILNVFNGRLYVGKASNLKVRREHHMSSLRGGYHKNAFLQHDFIKCGEGWFVYSVLEVTDSLTAREQHYLDLHYDHQVNCYNFEPVSGHSAGVKRSAETKERIRRAKTGIKATDETKNKMSCSHSGLKHSVASRAKMVNSWLTRKQISTKEYIK